MALSGVNGLGWYIQQLSGFAPGSAVGSTTAASANGASAASLSAGSNDASVLRQNLQVFMQALYEALSTSDAAARSASASSIANGTDESAAPEAGTPSKAQSAYGRSYGAPRSQGGLQGKIDNLISALGHQSATPGNADSQSSSQAVGGLQAAFNRLLQDLGGSGSGGASSLSAGGMWGAMSDDQDALTLNGWLGGLQQSLRQSAVSSFSPLGHLVDEVV